MAEFRALAAGLAVPTLIIPLLELIGGPMSTTLIMPKLEMSMSEGTLAEWKVEDGATVREGDVIYVLETDKTSRDIEAPASGTLFHKAPAGETYDVGTEIGEIV